MKYYKFNFRPMSRNKELPEINLPEGEWAG